MPGKKKRSERQWPHRNLMKKALTIFIGFVHDFAAGCWAATVAAVFWVNRIAAKNPALKSQLDSVEHQFFWAGIACIAIVFLAGAGRTFTYAYIGNVYGEESERLRRKMLAIKHVVLITIFGAGTYWQFVMAFR